MLAGIADRWAVVMLAGLTMSAALGQNDVAERMNEAVARPTVGLVLSGGGSRGAAHAGVIKVLDELRVPVDFIAGSSMGAVVGGLQASGMPADELERTIRSADWVKLLADRPPRAQRSFRRKSDDNGFLVNFDLGVDKTGIVIPRGLVQGQNLEIELKRLTLPAISIENFSELPIPYRAVATDIVTGEEVVLDSGDLATAMRASMSVPGVFKPVRRNNRLLVDGGIANNLPVQVVRDMGADVLIVVDVGFPLLAEGEIKSALDVSNQMLTILINAQSQKQSEQLTSGDILISPALGNLGSQDFHRSSEALELGKQSARQHAKSLAKYALSESEYKAYRRELEARLGKTPVIDRVVVRNESNLSPKIIAARMADAKNRPLDPDQLEADIADIYGLDTFEIVTYDIEDNLGDNTLTVSATQKSWGPNYLRFGINLEDDFAGDSNYNIAARLTRTEINKKGGEIRAELQIGESPRLFAELYQPLDFASRWFVNPQVEYQSESSELFDGRQQIAQFRSNLTQVALQGGRQFSNWGEFRVGLSRSWSDPDVRIGSADIDTGTVQTTGMLASFSYDTIDRFAIPRSGTFITSVWFGARESLGSDSSYDIAQLFFLKPMTWGNHTFFNWWNFSKTVNDTPEGIQPFSLGGLFNLSGYARDELAGKHSGIGRLLYYYRLGDETLPVLDTNIYFGASIEAGNVWQDSSEISFDNTLIAGSVFVVLDTLLGPLYIAYGAGEDGRSSAYLFLGQTF